MAAKKTASKKAPTKPAEAEGGTAAGVKDAIADIASIDQPDATTQASDDGAFPPKPEPVAGDNLSGPGPVPTLGRIVLYKSRGATGYVVPAVVTATADTLEPEGVATGQVWPIEGDRNVHLHVLTPGNKVQYQEANVPQASDPSDPEPGSWFWPPRA